MLKRGGLSLHIVPTFAKVVGTFLSPRHHIVFGTPTPRSLRGITDAAQGGRLLPTIGRTVPPTGAITAIVEQEQTGLPKGKLVVTPSTH